MKPRYKLSGRRYQVASFVRPGLQILPFPMLPSWGDRVVLVIGDTAHELELI